MDQEDALFLSSLGVTAAYPEDIERHVIAKVEQKAQEARKWALEGREEDEINTEEYDQDDTSAKRVRIFNRLRVLDQEIDAVAAGLESLKSREDEPHEDGEPGLTDQGPGIQPVDGSILQQALATDRLKSLERKRKQLKEQLKNEDEEADHLVDVLRGKDYESTSFHSAKKAKIEPKDSRQSKARKVSFFEDEDFDTTLDAASGLVETDRDRLIRTGVLTPFDRVEGFERRVQRASFSDASKQEHVSNKEDTENLSRNSIANVAAAMSALARSRPSTKLVDASELPKLAPPTHEFRRLRKINKSSVPDKSGKLIKGQGTRGRKVGRPMPEMKWRKRHQRKNNDKISSSEDEIEGKTEEEGSGRKEILHTQKLRRPKREPGDEGDEENILDNFEEPANLNEDVILEGGLQIPGRIYDNLFDYQKTGVKWLWELHCQRAGGIIGDEMGLGKTIQVIAFLAALHHSGMYKPSIIICPVTLLCQWKREVQKWYAMFDVKILHDSAVSHSMKGAKVKRGKNKSNKEDTENDEDTGESEEDMKAATTKGLSKWDALIGHTVRSDSGLLITTYEQLRNLREKLLNIQWGYAVLDEGHRIRNPDSDSTLVCKQLQTVHRIIMTGAPIQNRLTELWSLFDFVFPGKLGVLPVFQAQFSLPISIGGYANATPLQVTTAYKCAVVLRDLIMPYLLRRMKTDVYAQLPKKTEHVLFCSLTEEQRTAYRAFLASSEVEQIFEGNRNSLYGIDILRKICNHPDLLDREHSASHPDYGNPERSGKLKVVAQVLDLWRSQCHRVLIFTQTQQMLDILENYMIENGYVYRRMDGYTPVKQRMALIDEFNESNHVFVFILTTKVGGIGTNLIGANRVIIFDPDWNPSTDMQARERAWRIGQTRDVTIYRLITRGTIEEKVYHRQIYKHFLTNKILRDPQQRRFFKARDMRDLFTLQDDKHEKRTETSAIFAELAGDIDLNEENRNSTDYRSTRRAGAHENSRMGSVNEEFQENRSLNKGKEKAEAADSELQEDESRILKSLFEANGIHSAIDHDAIESMNDPEKMKVDNEASRVAQQAAEALRQSRLLRSSDNVAVPTWTGRSGTAGAPATVRRRFGSTINSRLVSSSSQARTETEAGGGTSACKGFTAVLAGSSVGKALSSDDILNRIRESRVSAASAGIEMGHQRLSASKTGLHISERGSGDNKTHERTQKASLQPEILIRQLCTFLECNGGSVSSASVVEKFRHTIPAHDVPLFRELLKEIATLRKEGAEAMWVLKEEYRQEDKG